MGAPSPFTEPAPATPDPLGLVAASVPLAILVGLLVVTATVFVVTTVRDTNVTAAAPASVASSAAFYVLVGGTFGAALLACLTAWISLSPITNTYRRGMFSVVSAFATVVVMLVAMPIHAAFGRAGLAVLGATCLTGIMLLARRVRRIRALR
ncbi:MAG: hypothetical protein H0U85_05830 [Gemmatimonadales bacterium]|nr:hypothetical protein [Gemmatimonadales bacterium]